MAVPGDLGHGSDGHVPFPEDPEKAVPNGQVCSEGGPLRSGWLVRQDQVGVRGVEMSNRNGHRVGLLWAATPDPTGQQGDRRETANPALVQPLPAPPRRDPAPPVAAASPPTAPAPSSTALTAPEAFTEEAMLTARRDPPGEGWRAWVFRLTGGAVNPGPSRAEMEWRALVDRCLAPAPEGRRIAVISRKGGVGKT